MRSTKSSREPAPIAGLRLELPHRRLIGRPPCVVYDLSEAAVRELEAEAAIGAGSLETSWSAMERPRAIWIMIRPPMSRT